MLLTSGETPSCRLLVWLWWYRGKLLTIPAQAMKKTPPSNITFQLALNISDFSANKTPFLCNGRWKSTQYFLSLRYLPEFGEKSHLRQKMHDHLRLRSQRWELKILRPEQGIEKKLINYNKTKKIKLIKLSSVITYSRNTRIDKWIVIFLIRSENPLWPWRALDWCEAHSVSFVRQLLRTSQRSSWPCATS